MLSRIEPTQNAWCPCLSSDAGRAGHRVQDAPWSPSFDTAIGEMVSATLCSAAADRPAIRALSVLDHDSLDQVPRSFANSALLSGPFEFSERVLQYLRAGCCSDASHGVTDHVGLEELSNRDPTAHCIVEPCVCRRCVDCIPSSASSHGLGRQRTCHVVSGQRMPPTAGGCRGRPVATSLSGGEGGLGR
jgi:hypothetical protein